MPLAGARLAERYQILTISTATVANGRRDSGNPEQKRAVWYSLALEASRQVVDSPHGAFAM